MDSVDSTNKKRKQHWTLVNRFCHHMLRCRTEVIVSTSQDRSVHSTFVDLERAKPTARLRSDAVASPDELCKITTRKSLLASKKRASDMCSKARLPRNSADDVVL